MNTIHIAICFNKTYIMPVAVLIQSIGANKGCEQIVIHAISTEDLPDSSKRVLNEVAERNGMMLEYHVFTIPEYIISSFTNMRWWSPELFLKLYIPEILPSLSKVLVMDGDMVVCHSLLDIWREDIENYALAGVVDSGFGLVLEVERDCYYNSGEYGYLNAGLLLMNLDYHREHNIHGRYIEWIEGNLERIGFLEQSVINNVVYDKKKILPLKYNLQFNSYVWKCKNNTYYSSVERSEAYFEPLVIHYIGSYKPWYKFCPHPYVNEWNRYLRQTPFSGYTKDFLGGVGIGEMSLRAIITMWLL